MSPPKMSNLISRVGHAYAMISLSPLKSSVSWTLTPGDKEYYPSDKQNLLMHALFTTSG